MDYSKKSVYDFCAEVYDFYSDFLPNNVSSVDMYNFLKQRTNNFQKELFDYVIIDIRNFIESIEFEIENPDERPELVIDDETGYPTNASSEAHYLHNDFIVCTITNLPSIYSALEDTFFKFKDEESLRERIEKLNLIPQIRNLRHNISNLLRFSDIAEKEYLRVLEIEKKKKEPFYDQKFSIFNLNSREFIEYCFNNEIPPLEMYDFIQKKTDSFDSIKIKLFIDELARFAERVHIYVTEEREYDNEKFTEEFNYYLLGYLNSYSIKNEDSPEAKEIIADIDRAVNNLDLKLALKTARKINPLIRTGLDYYSFINILEILENNIKQEPDIFSFSKQITNYYDLTLQEFLDVITDTLPVYELTFTAPGKDSETLQFKGTEQQILDALNNLSLPAYRKKQLINKYHSVKTPLFNKDLSEIEIYNYLEKITNNFDPEKCRIIYSDIDCYYSMVFLERINEESTNIYLENGWEIPQIQFKSIMDDELVSMPDYETMHKKTHLTDDFFIQSCLKLLKSKLPNKKKIIKNTYKTGTKQLSLSEIALISYYNGAHINKETAKGILEEFNIQASEKSLIEKYNFFQRKSNRTYSKAPKANAHHLKRMETVLEYLQLNQLPSSEAENDLKIFQENMEN